MPFARAPVPPKARTDANRLDLSRAATLISLSSRVPYHIPSYSTQGSDLSYTISHWCAVTWYARVLHCNVPCPSSSCATLPNLQYNQIFEFENCSMMGQTVNMKITSVTGHLMEIEFAEPLGKRWGACQPVELFTAPLVKYVKDVRGFPWEGWIIRQKRWPMLC